MFQAVLTYLHVSNAPEYKTSRATDESIGGVPDTNSARLFLALPPRTTDEHKSRVQTSFEDTEEKSQGSKGGKGPTCGHACKCYAFASVSQGAIVIGDHMLTPKNKVDGDVFASWKALHQKVRRIAGKHVATIKKSDEQAELLAFEIGLHSETICSCLTDSLNNVVNR